MKKISFDQLASSDLYVDALYEGGRRGNMGDDPLPRLLRMDSLGGFRKRGSVAGKLHMLVLTSSMADPDWPDSLDRETGVFTYYGDNKKPGQELHKTGRDGNLILQKIFNAARSGIEGRREVPPTFIFSGADTWRDMIFLGLVVPGASDLDSSEELVAIWRTAAGQRFQNYRARFTVLDASVISREWIDGLIAGEPEDSAAPDAWQTWVRRSSRSRNPGAATEAGTWVRRCSGRWIRITTSASTGTSAACSSISARPPASIWRGSSRHNATWSPRTSGRA